MGKVEGASIEELYMISDTRGGRGQRFFLRHENGRQKAPSTVPDIQSPANIRETVARVTKKLELL